MKKIKVWLTMFGLMMSVHTSALAGEVWTSEIRITNLNLISVIGSSEYTYQTSDPLVATVTADGIVSFHREGRVVISATQGENTFYYPYLVQTESVDTASFSAEVVRLVNEERARYGIAPLIHDTQYQVCADIRAEEAARYFSHTRPDGRSWQTVLNEYGLSNIYMAENLAQGSATPTRVVELWMGSDGHRASILNPIYTHLAVSCRQGDDGSLYWAQLFTRR